MSKPPKVRLNKSESLQGWYCDREGNRYSVARLIDDAKDLPVFEIPVAAMNLGDEIWRGENILGLAFHVRKCMKADLGCPILLDWHGDIADGRHRLIKAIATGKRTLKARRIDWKPTPDRPAEKT